MLKSQTWRRTALATLILSAGIATGAEAAVRGDYVEIRSCDVYTGSCFANAEMGLDGHEAILAWSIRQGAFDGVKLDGLNVIAVVRANGTLGDVNRFPPLASSVLIIDDAANAKQYDALVHFAQKTAGVVLGKTVRVDRAPIAIDVCAANCSSDGCACVQAGKLVEIETRCLGGKDHVCGNEELYYPPLTKVAGARPAYTKAGVFCGEGLGIHFDEANRRSAYLASFSE
jgi:hypothetical protein